MARVAYIALKQQTLPGGIEVYPGEEIPAEVGDILTDPWFAAGFVDKRLVIEEEPARKKAVKASA